MKICIDAGHYGKYNRSPDISLYYESVQMWELHLLLKKYLEQYGVEVVTTRSNQSKDVALETRGKMAAGCDLFISLHSNAVGSRMDEATDYPLACCCVYGKADALGLKLAQAVAHVMGTKQNGRITKRKLVTGADYYGVLRGAAKVGVPGVLLEHSFHTNTQAARWLLNPDNLDKLAKAEADVIADFYGLKKTKVEPADNSYLVRVVCSSLNIRKTPTWANSDVVSKITDKGVYTIVAETMLDGTKFGKLKSGQGWISLGSAYVKKV